MFAWFVLGMQASGAASGTPDPAPIRLTAPCPGPSDGGDVVVCGRSRGDEYRLKPLPDRYRPSAQAIPRAQVPLAGGFKGAAETEQADVGGFPSNRIMLRLKRPF